MPRGGRRQGKPGASYSNRVDLAANRGPVPMMAATGQPYGAAGAQMAAQRALPVSAPPPPAAGAPAGPPGRAVPPVNIVPLTDPTTRPGEPVTAGMAMGAGPGPEALAGPPGVDSPLRLWLGAAYKAFPTEEIRQMIEDVDSGLA